eukprot:9972686-Lingulodinium_polyedra.AAC.1
MLLASASTSSLLMLLRPVQLSVLSLGGHACHTLLAPGRPHRRPFVVLIDANGRVGSCPAQR